MSHPSSGHHVVVFAAGRTEAAAIELVEAIADAFPRWEFAIVHERPHKPAPGVRFRRGVSERLDRKVSSRRPRWDQRGGRNWLPESLDRIDRPNVRYYSVEALRSVDTARLISSLEPWLGIITAAAVERHSLLAIPRLGTITIQKEFPLPDRQGIGEARVAVVSVRRVEARSEADPNIAQASLAIPPYSTPEGLDIELDLLAPKTLIEALRRLDAGAATGLPEDQTLPESEPGPDPSRTRKAWRMKTPRRSLDQGSGHRLRERAKLVLFLIYLGTIIPLRNLARRLRGQSHVAVLLFHRVSDAYRDPITVGIEQFQDFLSQLNRHYDVLDLPEFLAGRGAPRRRPGVVLTFDDGYEDNYLAAVLLRRAGLPCTFFVSTGIVGDDTAAFPHDLKNLGHRVPALSWAQVRQMVRWGFRIGNHTVHHVNLGQTTTARAVEEITLAAGDLRRELGDDTPGARWLAYPYGKVDDITDELRCGLPGLGISHCFSAYGGTNAPDFDPSDVKRQNINFNYDATGLLVVVEGWVPRSRRRMAIRGGDSGRSQELSAPRSLFARGCPDHDLGSSLDGNATSNETDSIVPGGGLAPLGLRASE